MKAYDAVVIGAGPAGGECARELTQNGFKVLLADKQKNFLENNYSSGAAPLEIMNDFNLPNSIVGTNWDTFRIHSTHSHATWHSPSSFGPVIDFDKLREFLAAETTAAGGHVMLGCHYLSHRHLPKGIEVQLKLLDSSAVLSVETSILVDATGSERKVLAGANFDKKKTIAATGIEYHLQVDPQIYNNYARSLNFYLGHRWMPQGYGWIFSKAPDKLKVGVIRYFQNEVYTPHSPSHKPYLEQLLRLCGNYRIEDKHGKTIHYHPGQQDMRSEGRVVAIGDAISSINPLGWEGIRHAMVSGRSAAKTIVEYLRGSSKDLKAYDSAMNKYFGRKWFFSEKMMSTLFKGTSDAMIDLSVKSFQCMDNEEIMKVVFGYQFRHSVRAYFKYFLSRILGH